MSVPFSFFCDLVCDIGNVEPRTVAGRRKLAHKTDYPAMNIFKSWVNELRRSYAPLPPGTTAMCFKFLFPEEDVHRKYHIQEASMVELLAKSLGKQTSDFDAWRYPDASGCLGDQVRKTLSLSWSGTESDITMSEVDELLDELAALSGYTHNDIRSKYATRRTRNEIMRSLFRKLSPLEAGVATQIILKDLRPMLYPLTEFHYRVALINFNTAAVRMLSLTHAMNAWDGSTDMARFYRMRASLTEAAAFADAPERSVDDITPKIGIQITIPKSEKGLDCTRAVRHFAGSPDVWAETKYDGERAQIHVQVDHGKVKIRIFSKSGRESTNDRFALHDIIRTTLGNKVENVILDAEMVAFRGETIEEFWRIRQLICETARGIRRRPSRKSIPTSYEHDSMNSQNTDDLTLGLVFFDVLYLNGKSLLGEKYKDRRRILESLITVLPGQAILAARYRIDMVSVSKPPRHFYKVAFNKYTPTAEDDEAAAAQLCWVFASHIASFEEGLVLKADDSKYNDWNRQWVKMKKDYITGYGDNMDMVVLGASWEKERARSLRAPPSTLTTFYVGVLENKEAIENNPRIRPCFHIYFTVAYGLNRVQLEELNFLIQNSDPFEYESFNKKKDRDFNISILETIAKPQFILQTPLLFELFGAGFTKAEKSFHYELRFPRITKFHRPSERSWREGVDSATLHEIACASVGRDPSDWVIDREMGALFGVEPRSPSVRCPEKMERSTEEWFDKLTEAEGKPKRERPLLASEMLEVSTRKTPLSGATTPTKGKKKAVTVGGDKPHEESVKPLSSRTNVDECVVSGNTLLHQGEPVMTPERSLQLSIPQNPMTPPPSSPIQNLGRNAHLYSPSKKRTRSPMSDESRKIVKLSYPSQLRAARPELALSIPAPATCLPSPETEAEAEEEVKVRAEPQVAEPVYPDGVELDSTYVLFARPAERCAGYSGWRRKIRRPLHSLSAVRVGCGWTEHGLGHRKGGVQGVIILDECDAESAAWIERIQSELANSPPHPHLPIRVYGCRSTTTPLFEFL